LHSDAGVEADACAFIFFYILSNQLYCSAITI